MVLIAFEREVARFDQFQPLRLVHPSLGKLRHTLADHQLRRGEWLALELFVEHVQVVFVDVRIAEEIGKPARRVTGQATDQAQQRGAFREVERCAQAQIVGADVESQGDFPDPLHPLQRPGPGHAVQPHRRRRTAEPDRPPDWLHAALVHLFHR